MVYTVRQLSELSGVTVRTLHYYEEADLLQPAYYGSNGYRYYEQKELLQLQQILFFKELGFTLRQIKEVLGRSDFDQLVALHTHRKTLHNEWNKIGLLLKTIDKTIKHLKGKKKMKDKEMFDGFNGSIITKAKRGESYFAAEETLSHSLPKPSDEKCEKAYYDNLIKSAHLIFKELVSCIEKRLKSNSNTVQNIIKKHHNFVQQVHPAPKEIYQALAQLYLEHPAFRKQIDPFHPKLAEFMSQAMKLYADTL